MTRAASVGSDPLTAGPDGCSSFAPQSLWLSSWRRFRGVGGAVVALPATDRMSVYQRHRVGAYGGGRAVALIGAMVVQMVVATISVFGSEDAGESSSFLGTTLMAHGCHSPS